MISDKAVVSDKIDFASFGTRLDENGNLIQDISHIEMNGEKFETTYTSFVSSQKETNEKTESTIKNLSEEIKSLSIVGDQTFIKNEDGTIYPTSIRLEASCKNGTVIGKWYIDDIENGIYVSADKKFIDIPSSILSKQKRVSVKVEDVSKKIYDIKTIYLLEDGKNGQSALMPYIESSNGTMFDDSKYFDTLLTAHIRDNTGIIDEDGSLYEYAWFFFDGASWVEFGNGKNIKVNNTSFFDTGMYKFRAGNLKSDILITANGKAILTTSENKIDISYIDYTDVCFESVPIQLYKIHQGEDASSPYLITLSNENHSFNADYFGTVQDETIDIGIICFYGTEKTDCHIGSISVPDGMTVSISENDSTNPHIFITANSKLLVDNGSVSIPVVVDGFDFIKYFSWSCRYRNYR